MSDMPIEEKETKSTPRKHTTKPKQIERKRRSRGIVKHTYYKKQPVDLQLLDQAAGSRQVIDVGVRFALGADEAREGQGGGLAGVLAVSVDVANVDLHGGVVGGGDDAVGGGAVVEIETNANVRNVIQLNENRKQLKIEKDWATQRTTCAGCRDQCTCPPRSAWSKKILVVQ
jgi:hypothetical protein